MKPSTAEQRTKDLQERGAGLGGVLGIKNGVASAAGIYFDYIVINEATEFTSCKDDKGQTISAADLNLNGLTLVAGMMICIPNSRMKEITVTGGSAVGYKSTDQKDLFA